MSDMKELRPQLAEVQKYHLDLLETWGAQQAKICNVPAVQIFTYELIQIINNSYLRSVIGE